MIHRANLFNRPACGAPVILNGVVAKLSVSGAPGFVTCDACTKVETPLSREAAIASMEAAAAAFRASRR